MGMWSGVRRVGIPLPVDAGDVKRDPRTIEVGFLVVVRVRPNRFDGVVVSIPVARSSL